MLTSEEYQAVTRLLVYLRREGHDSDIRLIRKLVSEHESMYKILLDLSTVISEVEEQIHNTTEESFNKVKESLKRT